MIYVLCQRAVNAARNFLRDQGGSIIIYTGAFIAVGMGGAALSIDIGRVVLLKTQMQNRADAAAMAGAAQLDAKSYAIDRATYIMFDSMKAFTTAGADQAELVLIEANFYAVAEDKISRGLPTDDYNLARFAEAIMQKRALSFFYAPAMNVMTGKAASNYTVLDSRAVAMSDPFICKMQPMMICNPFDNGDGTSSADLTHADFAGVGMRIKQSGKTGAWQPGNFGLLDLPEDAAYTGGGGANAVQDALEAEEPLGCYAVDTLSTAPGVKTNAVQKGINVRWGLPLTDSTVRPAPNVMNYPIDDVMITDPALSLGDGFWDLPGYWTLNHPGVALPADLAGASRYQVYLFEQGVVYWKGKGKKTTQVATVPGDAATNWDEIDSATDYPDAGIIPAYPTDVHDNDRDGWPPPGQVVADQGYKRRLMKIAVANCATNTYQGLAEIPGEGVYIEYFLTEQAGTSAEGATIYGEMVGGIEARTSVEFHGNVRLTE